MGQYKARRPANGEAEAPHQAEWPPRQALHDSIGNSGLEELRRSGQLSIDQGGLRVDEQQTPTAQTMVARFDDVENLGSDQFTRSAGSLIENFLRGHDARIAFEIAVNVPLGASGWIPPEAPADIRGTLGFGLHGYAGLEDDGDVEGGLGFRVQGTGEARAWFLSIYGQLFVDAVVEARGQSAGEMFDLMMFGVYDQANRAGVPLGWLFGEDEMQAVAADFEEGEYVSTMLEAGRGWGIATRKQRTGEENTRRRAEGRPEREHRDALSGITYDESRSAGAMSRLDGQGEGQTPERTVWNVVQTLRRVRPGEIFRPTARTLEWLRTKLPALDASIVYRMLETGLGTLDRVDVSHREMTNRETGGAVQSDRAMVRFKIDPKQIPRLAAFVAGWEWAEGVFALARLNGGLRALFETNPSLQEDLIRVSTAGPGLAALHAGAGYLTTLYDGAGRRRRMALEGGLYLHFNLHTHQVGDQLVISLSVDLVIDTKGSIDSNDSGRPDNRDTIYAGLLVFNNLLHGELTLPATP